MGVINLLDVEVSNKIAAGEVVERPASVVKELVENSIDAGANKIIVEIKNGGNTYIKVADNGCGMEKEDAAVAFLRHATSKISKEEDLNAIYTLGFRGEALSSIGAVARVDLYTKRRCDEFGIHTICEGGEIISDDDAAIPDGTIFIVRDLFYNVPARMKFLKKDSTEAGYISDIMTRFVLSHPEIAFKLISNGKTMIESYGDGKLENCVYSVYGRDYASAMINVLFETEYVKVAGLCGKGSTARANRSYQSFFVNSRYIKSPLITRAVEEAYKNQIMIGKFPTAVLNLEINPALVDINVHPTKLEVKFSNESEIYRAVYHAVKEALFKIADVPEIKITKPKKEEIKTAFIPDKVIENGQIKLDTQQKQAEYQNGENHAEGAETPPEIKPIETTIKKPAEEKEHQDDFTKVPLYFGEKLHQVAAPALFSDTKDFDQKANNDELLTKTTPIEIKETKQEKQEVADIKLAENEQENEIEFRLIGQLFDTYIIVEIGDEMRIIDQHAAHERLKFEEIKKETKNRAVYSQGLAIASVVKLSSIEFAVFEQNAEFIASLGFEAEEYGENTVIIRSVPTGLMDEEISELFVEILQQLDDNKREIITEKKERLLYTIACKAAIKANHKLSEKEQTELVKMVLSLDNINTCPHGRPIVISMSKKEIEKNFKRIV